VKLIFQIIKRILIYIPGEFFGLLSVSSALGGILIAFFPFSGYNILFCDVSYLAASPYGIIFNIGLIFSGLIAIPFHFSMIKQIESQLISIKLKKTILSLSLTSSLTLSLIGFFPVLTGNVIILLIHGILALITFLGVTIYCFLYGVLFLKDQKFSFFHSFLSFSVSGIFIFYFTNRWSLIEWIAVLSIMVWITFNALYSLTMRL
jgi:hypothetical membrane protein